MINDAGKHEVKTAAEAVTLSAGEDAIRTDNPSARAVGLPLPLGERVGVRGLNPFRQPIPLTRLALLADLSPQGRGEGRVCRAMIHSHSHLP